MSGPPRFARTLLAALLPPADRRVILDDLDAEFTQAVAARGAAAARRAYRWHVARSLPGALRLRLRRLGRDLAADLRFGGRLLRRQPGFSSAVTLTLMLGVGAATAVLTMGHAVLVSPLPYRDVARITTLDEIDRAGTGSGALSWQDFQDYAAGNVSTDAVAAYSGGSRTLLVAGAAPERVPVCLVTGRFFDVLGVTPLAGRAFVDADTAPGAAPVVLLTEHIWRERFGADSSIVGRLIDLNGTPTSVIGILPARFEFPLRGLAELWLPEQPTKAQLERRYYHWANGLARLKPGVSITQATADFDRVARRLADVDPTFHSAKTVRLTPIRDRIVGDVRPMLFVLFAAAMLVLAVAAANIAGLLLARSATRQTEMDVRAAIGAGRGRLVRQLLAESVALALPGGLLGLVAGNAALRVFVAAVPRGQRAAMPHLNTLTLDGTAVLLSVALTVAAALLFGVVPAMRLARAGAPRRARGVAGQSRRDIRAQSALVVVQVAFAMVLLFGAGLLTQSMRHLFDVPAGFETAHMLTATVNLSGDRYRDPDAVVAFHEQALAALAALPGVTAAATVDQPPLAGTGNNGSFAVRSRGTDPTEFALVRTVSANYFSAMGVRVTMGRVFRDTDTAGFPRVVMVNQLVADRVFAGRPVGERISFPFVDNGAPLEIVGVVANERYGALDGELSPVVYFPYAQDPGGSFNVMIRTAAAPGAVSGALRSTIARLDPALPVYGVTTMDDLVNSTEAVFRRRAMLMLMAGFAVIALVLAAVGLYGVLAQTVAQRSKEIGVRLALGAGGQRITAAVLSRALMPAAAGLAVGGAAAVALGRQMRALLFGVAPADPTTLAAVVGILAAVSIAAAVIPVRRAVRIDPASALRQD